MVVRQVHSVFSGEDVGLPDLKSLPGQRVTVSRVGWVLWCTQDPLLGELGFL